MALRYMLSRDSEAHIPALRDKVMMGAHACRPALSLTTLLSHTKHSCMASDMRRIATLAALHRTRTSGAGEISMYEVVTLQDAEAAALAGRPWPPVSDADGAAGAGVDGSDGQLPAAMEVEGGPPGTAVDDAAPMVGPLLPGGSYLAGGPMAEAAPATTPQVVLTVDSSGHHMPACCSCGFRVLVGAVLAQHRLHMELAKTHDALLCSSRPDLRRSCCSFPTAAQPRVQQPPAQPYWRRPWRLMQSCRPRRLQKCVACPHPVAPPRPGPCRRQSPRNPARAAQMRGRWQLRPMGSPAAALLQMA